MKKIREALGFTQVEFAHELGISVTTISRWEQGRNKPGRVAAKLLEQMEQKTRF